MKKRTKCGKVPLYFRITINDDRTEFSAGREVPISQWDAKLQKVKGSSKEAVSLNSHLEAIKISLHRHHSRLVTLGKIVTSQMLRNEYLGITNDRKTLEEAMEFFLKKYKEKVEKNIISWKTLEKYENIVNKLRAFIKKNFEIKDLPLNEITPSFMDDFAHYLLTDCNLQHNTAMKKISMAKSIFIMAHKRGWMLSNPTREYIVK